MQRKTNLGFTTIEAVVVVTLITLMAVAGFGRIFDAEKAERDQIRRADLAEIRSRLVDYYFDNQFVFPADLEAINSEDDPLPTDPLSNDQIVIDYSYTVDINGDGVRKDFRLEAGLESPIEDQSTYTITVER